MVEQSVVDDLVDEIETTTPSGLRSVRKDSMTLDGMCQSIQRRTLF